MDMKKVGLVVIGIIIVAAAVILTEKGGGYEEQTQVPSAGGLALSSSAFENNGPIPEKYTFDGQDISPPLNISGSEGESLAIIMDDPDAKGFVHWLIWNIPGDTENIPEGIPQNETVQILGGAKQGQNGFGEIGYRGPKPPKGEEHEYRIRLYSLDGDLDLKSGASEAELQEAMEGKMVQEVELVGTYER